MKQIGDVELPTPYGKLKLSNVLYCPSIQGTIISVGKFKRWNGEVKWDGGKYTLVQNNISFPSFEINDRCFLPITLAPASVAAVRVASDVLHERIGHLSRLIFLPARFVWSLVML